MDGNDSLKRYERREDPVETKEGEIKLGASRERSDSRVGGGDYFLTKKEVDAWDERNWESVVEVEKGTEAGGMKELWEEGQCEERWHNANEKNTAKSVAKFHEQGWVVLLCRHMFLLKACDMIRSGEQ